MVISTAPFAEDHELTDELNALNDAKSLPGYPQLSLQDTEELYSFLSRDLCTPNLEKMAPRLWWMTKQSSAHVAPLHHQAVKLRRIVITEDPELHLVWYYDLIYIKPLPKYLSSHAFWTKYLTATSSSSVSVDQCGLLRRAALGFLRTYWHLVQYESDFNIAKEMRLIPSAATWESFSAFISSLKSIQDEEVTQRYHFGQIRLSRLNFYCKFLLGQRYFHDVHGQYDTYFARLYGPLLFIFGIASLCLSSLQVEMAVEPLVMSQWPIFWSFSRYLGVSFLGFIFSVLLVLISLFLAKFVTEWFYAFRDRNKKLRQQLESKKKRSGNV